MYTNVPVALSRSTAENVQKTFIVAAVCAVFYLYACLQIRPVRQSAASGTLYALYVKYNNNEKRIIKRT